jgi:hypothetical protein
MIMSRSGIVDSVVSILRSGFVNLTSKVETMREWLWNFKIEFMDVMIATARICLFYIHCVFWFVLAKFMLLFFSFDPTLCFDCQSIGLALGYMSNEAQWKTKINSQTCFDICHHLEVPLYGIVIIPYVSRSSSNFIIFRSLGSQRCLGFNNYK